MRKTEEIHDHRFCLGFHSDKDHRRNPYKDFYEVDECLSSLEQMYHPIVFGTTQCNRGPHCPFGTCSSHAHSVDGLRYRDDQEDKNYELDPNRRDIPLLSSFVPAIGRTDYRAVGQTISRQHHLPTRTWYVGLTAAQTFLLQRSPTLRIAIDEHALEEGLGCISMPYDSAQSELVVNGIYVDRITAFADEAMSAPSKHFVVQEREDGERVVENLKDAVKDPQRRASIIASNMVHVDITNDDRVSVDGVDWNGVPTKAAVDAVTQKIDLWVQQVGYNKFSECQGCFFSERNPDQGIACANGHFFCSVEGDESCLETAVSSQIENIRSRDDDGALVCYICRAPYDTEKLATHLSSSTWKAVQEAIVGKKVEKQTVELQRMFDQRLQEKVQELLSESASSSDAALKLQAQRLAQEARNAIMNLCCPHCHIAYAEFTDCMALQSQSCKGHFCGYCHQGTATGMGAHDHVRQCLVNECNNGSYYASSQEIERAQRWYKTRKLKQFLRKHKKKVQNAVAFELTRDLQDVGIQPEALFEVGNLHEEA